MAAAPPPTSSVVPLVVSRVLPLMYVAGCRHETRVNLCWQNELHHQHHAQLWCGQLPVTISC